MNNSVKACAALVINTAHLDARLFPTVVHVGNKLISNSKEKMKIHVRGFPERPVYIQVFTAAIQAGSCFLTGIATLKLCSFRKPYECLNEVGLLFFQKFVSYLGATLLWDLNSDSFLLNFEVVEEMPFEGHTIELCIFKDGRFVERGGLTIQVCGKLVCLRLTGDMSFIYKLLGHSSGFRHDCYRCIYCKHDFKQVKKGRCAI